MSTDLPASPTPLPADARPPCDPSLSLVWVKIVNPTCSLQDLGLEISLSRGFGGTQPGSDRSDLGVTEPGAGSRAPPWLSQACGGAPASPRIPSAPGLGRGLSGLPEQRKLLTPGRVVSLLNKPPSRPLRPSVSVSWTRVACRIRRVSPCPRRHPGPRKHGPSETRPGPRSPSVTLRPRPPLPVALLFPLMTGVGLGVMFLRLKPEN